MTDLFAISNQGLSVVLFCDSSNYNFYECCHLRAELPDDSYSYIFGIGRMCNLHQGYAHFLTCPIIINHK